MPEFSLTFTASVGANTKPATPEHRAAVVADDMAMNTEAFMTYREAGVLLAHRHLDPTPVLRVNRHLLIIF